MIYAPINPYVLPMACQRVYNSYKAGIIASKVFGFLIELCECKNSSKALFDIIIKELFVIIKVFIYIYFPRFI